MSKKHEKKSKKARRNHNHQTNDLAPLQMMKKGSYLDLIEPPERDVMLCYPFAFTLGGAATISRRFNPNAAFDVDPTLGSTSTPGFAEMAQLYAFYRVVKTMYIAEISNTDALPVYAYAYLSNTDPGTAMPYTVIGNPLAKGMLLSAGGGGKDTCVLKDSQTIATILGSNEVETDPLYRALVTTVPADVAWLCIGVHTPGGVAIVANAVNVVIRIFMLTRFFDRITALVSLKKNALLANEVAALMLELVDLKTKLGALEAKEDAIVALHRLPANLLCQ